MASPTGLALAGDYKNLDREMWSEIGRDGTYAVNTPSEREAFLQGDALLKTLPASTNYAA